MIPRHTRRPARIPDPATLAVCSDRSGLHHKHITSASSPLFINPELTEDPAVVVEVVALVVLVDVVVAAPELPVA